MASSSSSSSSPSLSSLSESKNKNNYEPIDFDSLDLEWKHQENTNSDDLRAVEMAAECCRRLTEATQKIIDNIKEKGFLMETMPEDKNWMWREARLRDPDGHQLILYHAGNNRKYPPWRLLDK